MTYRQRNGETEPPTEAGWYGIEDTRYATGGGYRQGDRPHAVVRVAQFEGQLCQMDWLPPRPIEGVTYLRWWGPWSPWEQEAGA